MNFIRRSYDLYRAFWQCAYTLSKSHWASKAKLLAIREKRLQKLLRYAGRHSPFYQKRWNGKIPHPGDLLKLEPVTKNDILNNYDQVLTGHTLNRQRLEKMLGENGRHAYIVLATSGTTGEPLIVPYSRSDWLKGISYFLQAASEYIGLYNLALASRRAASITTRNPNHVSVQLFKSFNLIPRTRLILETRMHLDEQIEKLQTFQPTMLSGYPSTVDRIARAQLEGKLNIQPRLVMVSGEPLPEGLRDRVRKAWKIELHNCYSLTEALFIGWECRGHSGMHINETAVILEVVDEKDRVLPPGKLGDAVLVTNLFNYTFPLIRYRVQDIMAIDDAFCSCGHPTNRILSIEGRSAEMLSLKGINGQAVLVHPFIIKTLLETHPGIRRFQIRNIDNRLQVLLVPNPGYGQCVSKIREMISADLAPHSVRQDAISVEAVAEIKEKVGKTGKRIGIIRK